MVLNVTIVMLTYPYSGFHSLIPETPAVEEIPMVAGYRIVASSVNTFNCVVQGDLCLVRHPRSHRVGLSPGHGLLPMILLTLNQVM